MNLRRIITLILLCTSTTLFAQKIIVSVHKAKMNEVFREIEKQSNFQFIYTAEQLRDCSLVSYKTTRAGIVEILAHCFSGQPITYQISGKYIIIQEKKKFENTLSSTNYSGRVVNDDNEPEVAATITVAPGNYSTQSDSNGNFWLKNVHPGTKITCSSIGFESQEIMLTGNKRVQVQLTRKVAELDKALILGYGNSSKRYEVGSVGSLNANDFAQQPVANPLQALQGKTAGVFVQTENGLPGGNVRMQIRGRGSIDAGTDPLFIVDGVPFLSAPFSTSPMVNAANGPLSPFAAISSSDIESIKILKDGDATSLYGSRGGNGVVLISLKKPSKDKFRFRLDVSRGMGAASRKLNLLSPDDYLAIRREAFANSSIVPDVSNAPDLVQWRNTSTDWQEKILGNAASLNAVQSSVSGSAGRTSYLLSAGFLNQGNILPGKLSNNRVTSHFAISHRSVNNKLRLSLSAFWSGDKNEIFHDASIVNLIYLPPNFPVYNDDGSLNWSIGKNPVALMLRRGISKTKTILSNFVAEYAVAKHLRFRLNTGYTRMQLNKTSALPGEGTNPRYNMPDAAIFSNNLYNVFVAEPLLEHTLAFKHLKLVSTVGSTLQHTVQVSSGFTGKNFVDSNRLFDRSAVGSVENLSNLNRKILLFSAFAKMAVRWKDRYLLNVSYRRDQSREKILQKQNGNFGAVGVGWLFTEMTALKNNHLLSFGKLKASYGNSGNDQQHDPSNSELYRWELKKKWEAGIESGWFDDRLFLAATFYQHTSSNLSLPLLSAFAGTVTSALGYSGAVVANSGWELEFQLMNAKNHKLKWNIMANFSLPKNKLIHVPDPAVTSSSETYQVGKDLSTIYLYHFTGVNATTGAPTFQDLNADNQINYPSDFKAVGKTSPDFFGGVGSTLALGSFEFSMFIQFAGQHSLTNFYYPGLTPHNQLQWVKNRWQRPGDISTVPIAATGTTGSTIDASAMLSSSDFTLVNSTYFRLKNLYLAYKVPKRILQRMKVAFASLYLDAANAFTMGARDMLDPETSNGNFATMPVTRQLIAGIRLEF